MDLKNQVDELKRLVEKLKRNDSNVSKEDLMTKYKKPYMELKNEIKKKVDELTDEILIEGLLIVKDERGYKCLEDISQFVEKKKDEGIIRQCSDLIFKKYDVDKVVELAKDVKTGIDKIYSKYLEEVEQ
ncbi:hypothetical protein [Lachnoanaerobaculum saburreum]|uniref:Uncharacterized protein n=1 Tax=Lachnoanaerobaculum saburreum DSM 3986 TaxID=887325 RepID=E6LK90_9FIRM|nr:hypothetical protein [Lachnoanaerobaculum saburreum]EFU77730.1 hypothetical protein HMPREF0381_0375 [Lachnoanaerobaculum saburreum DSM 3986]DAS00954.1 MAG TPA: hypothetical protein [Caudoviricetes sp.]